MQKDNDPTQPGEASPIDHAHLDSYTEGDRVLERELLDLFVSNADRYVAALAVDADAAAWYSATHALKGSALSIGAFTLALLAEAAEMVPAGAAARAAARASLTAALADVTAYVARRRAGD